MGDVPWIIFSPAKDYRVHKEAVEIITDDKYGSLWNVKAADILDDATMNLIFDAKERINATYSPDKQMVEPEVMNSDISDTLVTKILMGTFGCVPAYDEFFQKGVRMYKIVGDNYTKPSLQRLAKFYTEHERTFEHVRWEISRERGVEYPQMKLVGMCFWQIGIDV